MLVIIIIIAVVSSIVVPSYSRFMARANFQGATRRVQDLFAYAREQAVVNDTTVIVRFDPSSQTFMAMVTPTPPPTDQPAVFGASAVNAVQSTPEPLTVSLGDEFAVGNYQPGTQSAAPGGNAGDINFRGDGTCDGLQMTLMSEAGYQAQLLLWPSTGRVTVEVQ